MTTITFDEFQKHLGDYFRRVRQGETVRVEQGGEVPVNLHPVPTSSWDRFEVRSLEEVLADPRPNPKGKYPRFERLYEGNVSQSLLDLERGER